MADWGASVSDIRAMTDITTSDLTDTEITNLLRYAGSQFNSQVMVKIIEESIGYIDDYRTNKIDGSNTTYYLSKSWDWYLGDLDDDGDLDISDLQIYQYNPTTDVKTTLTAATVNERGSFTLSSAPSGVDLQVTYRYMPLSIDHYLVRKAVTELTSAIAYRKMEAREDKSLSIGALSLKRKAIAYETFLARYIQTISEINATQLLRKQIVPIRIPTLPILIQFVEKTTGTGAELR